MVLYRVFRLEMDIETRNRCEPFLIFWGFCVFQSSYSSFFLFKFSFLDFQKMRFVKEEEEEEGGGLES
jgi:hypothetical protein